MIRKESRRKGTQMAQSVECLLSNREDLSLVCSAYIKKKKKKVDVHP